MSVNLGHKNNTVHVHHMGLWAVAICTPKATASHFFPGTALNTLIQAQANYVVRWCLNAVLASILLNLASLWSPIVELFDWSTVYLCQVLDVAFKVCCCNRLCWWIQAAISDFISYAKSCLLSKFNNCLNFTKALSKWFWMWYKSLLFSLKLFLCYTSSEVVFMELSSGHLSELAKRTKSTMSALGYYLGDIPDIHVHLMILYQVVGWIITSDVPLRSQTTVAVSGRGACPMCLCQVHHCLSLGLYQQKMLRWPSRR